VQIAPGPHRIDVRREGYRSYTAQVDVRAGQTAPINISLPRQ
jgi:PEGA domain